MMAAVPGTRHWGTSGVVNAISERCYSVYGVRTPHGNLVASPADRATGQGALSPCRQGITTINGWSKMARTSIFGAKSSYQPCRQGSGQMCTESIFGMIPRNFFTASGWVLCVWLHRETDSFSIQNHSFSQKLCHRQG